MEKIACRIMGSIDILAGVLIMFGFGFNTFAIALGILMIGKGGFSIL